MTAHYWPSGCLIVILGTSRQHLAFMPDAFNFGELIYATEMISHQWRAWCKEYPRDDRIRVGLVPRGRFSFAILAAPSSDPDILQ